MKTKDRVKEEIGFDKLLMTIAFAMFSSLVGWLFTSRDQGLSLTTICILFITAICLAAITALFKRITIRIKELDYDQQS